MDGHADRARLRLARPVRVRRGGRRGHASLANFFFLRESRVAEGRSARPAQPAESVRRLRGPDPQRAALLAPLLRSRAFLLVCLLSFGCTIMRETFNTWTPEYLREQLGYSMSHAAAMSAIFPGVGAVSVLPAGWLSDRLGLNGRSLLLFLGLAATAAALLAADCRVHPKPRRRCCRWLRSAPSPFACSGPILTWAAHLRWISAASRRARHPRGSSMASAISAACWPATALRGSRSRSAGRAYSWRWPSSARSLPHAPALCMC